MANIRWKKRGVSVTNLASGDPHFHVTLNFNWNALTTGNDDDKLPSSTESNPLTKVKVLFRPQMVQDGSTISAASDLTQYLTPQQIDNLVMIGSVSIPYKLVTDEQEKDYKYQVVRGDLFKLGVYLYFTYKDGSMYQMEHTTNLVNPTNNKD